MKFTKPPLSVNQQAVSNERVFVVLTLLRQLLIHTAPQTQWRERLYTLLDAYPEIPRSAMGAPADWKQHPLWL